MSEQRTVLIVDDSKRFSGTTPFEPEFQVWRADSEDSALACLRGQAASAFTDATTLGDTLKQRLTLMRAWSEFFNGYPLLLLPVSAETAFPVDLDLDGPEGYARVWQAQIPQIAPPLMGLPAPFAMRTQAIQ